MVRTKADAATARVSGAKAPRKIQATPSATAKKAGNTNGCGGNPYCPRETPKWQKEITKFFQPKNDEDNETIQTDAIEPNNQEQMTDNDPEQIEASNGKKNDDEGENSSEAA